ncbi:Ulp1 family isopeptidase [Orientia tsutsugamushi]|uniref:Ulp1 family isopeptidase n=1 Tax=Orientia tsutsugamushi TaxID=784 RepID=UPI000D5A4AAE|nr:Uncharacterised protein [Orientia tsutsugamushi]
MANDQDLSNTEYLYTEDDINQLLKHYLGLDDRISIIQHVALNESLLLKQTLHQVLSDIFSGIQEKAVIPLHTGNNHWVAMAIKKGISDEIVISYNDPMGIPIDDKVTLINCIKELCPGAKINDLQTVQQTNVYDCGPFVVDNLIKMSQGQPILSTEEAKQQAQNIRQSQVNFLSENRMITSAAAALADTLLENNNRITEGVLVDKIFDNEILSVQEKQQLLNNLLDSHIKENKSLTKESLTKMLAGTHFVQQQANVLLNEKFNKSTANLQASNASAEVSSPEELSVPKINQVEESLEAQLKYINEHIASQLMQIVKNNNGEIDCNSSNFQEKVSSLLNSQSKETTSLATIEQNFNKIIQQLRKEKVHEERVSAIELQLKANRAVLEAKLSNTEDVKSLVNQKIKEETLQAIPFFGNAAERANFKKHLAHFVKLPDNSYSLLKQKEKRHPFCNIVGANAVKFFSPQSNAVYLNTSAYNQITSGNLKAFEAAVTTGINNLMLKEAAVTIDSVSPNKESVESGKDLSKTDELAKLKEVKSNLETELKFFKGRLVQELMQIVKNENGRIDHTSKNWQESASVLLNSQKKGAVSLAEVERAVSKMTQKLREQNVSEEEIVNIESKLKFERVNLEAKLFNDNEIKELINKRIKEDALRAIPFIGSDSESFIKKIRPFVKLPDDSYSLLKANDKNHPFQNILYSNALKFFANSSDIECLNNDSSKNLTPENLNAFEQAVAADIDKLMSRDVTLNVSDLKSYVANSPNPDLIADYLALEWQVHTPGLKGLYDDLQASPQLQLNELENKHAKQLLSDLANLSKLPSMRGILQEFKDEFYNEIDKKPEERSVEYKNFINKCSELSDHMLQPAKCSAQALLEFNKYERDLNSFKQGVFCTIDNYKNSGTAQSKRDFNRAEILYKGPDGVVKEITLQELQESQDLALSNEQRDFLVTSWQQGNFRSGSTAIYGGRKFSSKSTGMIFDGGGRCDILIDASNGTKVHSRYFSTFAESQNIDEERVPCFDSTISVDISNMTGDKFIPGCSSAPQILINMHKFDPAVSVLDIPEGLKVTRSYAEEAIDNVKKDFVSGALNMICSPYTEKDISTQLSKETLDTKFARGWRNITETLGLDNALDSIIKEVYSQNSDGKSLKTEPDIQSSANEVMMENILDIVKRARSSVDSSSLHESHSLTLQRAVDHFCKVEFDPILREKFAAKCLDTFFSEQQGNIYDKNVQKAVEEEVTSILLPLCSDKEKKEKAILKKNTSAMVKKLVFQPNNKKGWYGAWENFKNTVSNVVGYLTGQNRKVEKLISSHPEITRSLKRHLSDSALSECRASSESISENLSTAITSKVRRNSTGNIR